MFYKQLLVRIIHFWLCQEAFYEDRKRIWEKDHMPDEAVNGSLNHRMQGRRARQMVLTIDPKHAHTLPLTYGSILDHYTGFVFSCRGSVQLLGVLVLELKYAVCLTWAEMCRVTPPPPHTGHKTIHSIWFNLDGFKQCCEMTRVQTHDRFCTFYLQNVLKFSVQHLTNEVQQIMHASLALLYPLLRLAIFVFFCRRWGIQKRKKGETDLQKKNQGLISNVNLRSVCE